MKKHLLFISFFVLAFSVFAQDVPSSFTANIKGGLFMTGPGKPNVGGTELDLKVSPALKLDLDGILVPKLSMGLFFLYTPMKLKDSDENNNFMSVGMTIKPRFTVATGLQIRPGVAIGYNHIKNKDMEDPSNGLNIGFQIEVSKTIQENLGIVGEFGFASQPVGGDGNVDITFPPIFYLCLGLEFGK
jgi:hypothetical protein